MKARIRHLEEEIRALEPHTLKGVCEPAKNEFFSIKDIAIAETASRKANNQDLALDLITD